MRGLATISQPSPTLGLATRAAGILLLGGLAGCQSKINASQRGGQAAPEPAPTELAPDPTPEPAPVELRELLDEPRTHFQTRSVVTLDLRSDQLHDGYDFYLSNDTTSKLLIERQVVDLGLTGEPFYSSLVAGYDVSLRLFPSDADMAAKLSYGKNELTLWLEGDGGKAFSRSTIWLQDFDLQMLARSSFSTDVQVLGGFQGWVGTVAQPVVATDGVGGASILTTDGFRILND
jgi:hypothetical protein